MRSVPHRMICLMGLDDGAFPRHGAPDGDDILALDPRVGDRNVRGEDRQLLLDALMAATDRLVIAYSGRDERTNAPLPPAVPVGELLDVVDATVRVEEGRARDRVVVRHPLQPFDARNFTAGALGRPGPWGFDRAALAGARALETAAGRVAPFLDRPLPPSGGDPVPLELLGRFVEHPVGAFLRERLGVTVSRTAEGGDESIPIEPDGLQRWAIGERFVQARLRGGSAEDARAAELARGTLPPDALGPPILATIEGFAERVSDAAAAFSCGGEARSLALDAALPGGRPLVGVIGGIGDDLIWHVAFSRLGPAHRLAAWVRFLALCAAEPERPWRSVIVGRLTAGSTPGASLSVIEPIGRDAPSRRDAALGQLGVLVDLLDRGMREPLPLYRATSAAYAEATLAGDDPIAVAAKAWDGGLGPARREPGRRKRPGARRCRPLRRSSPRGAGAGRVRARLGPRRAHPLRPPRPAPLERASRARADREPVSAAIPAFRADGPLPVGVTLLEASAGTGKTHTIASLVARYVADGTPLEELLVVTFTRAATSELRERVRVRLLEAEAALAEAAAGMAARDDEVLALLSAGTPGELAVRRDRIGRALADFDAATIATTHGFCQQVLEGLGTAGDSARDAVFAEDIGDLVGEVVGRPLPPRLPHDAPGAVHPEGRPRDRPGGRPERPRAARAPRRAGRLSGGDAGRAGPRGPIRARAPQAPDARRHLRRLPDAPPRDPDRPRPRRGRLRAGSRALPGGPDRRVPGHRPRPVGDRATGLLTGHARPDRRPQAGDLLLPRSGRAHVPARGRARPRPARPSRPTGAATRRSSTPTTPSSGERAWGTRRSPTAP